MPFNRATENPKKQKICKGRSGENVHASELPVTDFIVSVIHKVIRGAEGPKKNVQLNQSNVHFCCFLHEVVVIIANFPKCLLKICGILMGLF